MMMILKLFVQMGKEYSKWILTIKEITRQCLLLKLINKADILMLNLKIHKKLIRVLYGLKVLKLIRRSMLLFHGITTKFALIIYLVKKQGN
jgi:hypothetical protein